jgi:MoxR-like ATPase
MPSSVPVYQGLSDEDIERLSSDLASAYSSASTHQPTATPPGEEDESEQVISDVTLGNDVPPLPSLLGVDPSVYRQINAALLSGKQHLMFYGPPGTGKTTLAQHCARSLASRHTLITGSSDWSSQDVIGGYQPVGGGRIEFIPGILLRHFDRPLIIDELNRCDIDKVIGPLFTVLSGQKTTLPYRVKVDQKDSEFFEIFPKPNPTARTDVEFSPGPAWRIIATINSIDKASLYQMSYALMRRFAWIYLDVPTSLGDFLQQYLAREHIQNINQTDPPLATIWRSVNEVRAIGPAPLIEMVKVIRLMDGSFDFDVEPTEAQATVFLDAFDMFLLPLLDGIFRDAALSLSGAICSSLGAPAESSIAKKLERRLLSVAV